MFPIFLLFSYLLSYFCFPIFVPMFLVRNPISPCIFSEGLETLNPRSTGGAGHKTVSKNENLNTEIASQAAWRSKPALGR